MIRVLITSLGSTAAQNLVHVLKRAEGFFLLGVDVRERHGGSGLCDREETVPPGADPTYASELAELASRHAIDLLVPVMEPELLACARARSELERGGVRVLVPPEATLATCLSKRRTADVLAGAGVPVERRRAPEEVRRFPVFTRPDGGTGSRGAGIASSRAELDLLLERDPELLVSEWVEGPEFSVDGFADGGRLIHAIRRTRDEVKGGLATDSTVVPLEPFRDLVADACSALALSGFFNLQFHLDEAGEPRVFDVNPRLGGGMLLSFQAGLDAVGYLRRVSAGESPEPGGEEAVGLRLLRRWHNTLWRDGERCHEF